MKKLRMLAAPYLKIGLVLFFVIASFIYAMFQGGFVSWFLFYSFIPFALYPLLLSIYPLKNVEISRRFNESEYRADEQMEVELTLKRTNIFPLLYLTVEDQLPERFLTKTSHQPKGILFPLFRKEMKLTYTIPKAVRGDHHFEQVLIKTGDFLGLYERATAIESHNHLLVYPRYNQMTARQLEAMYEEGQQSAFVRKHNETALVSGVRDYAPGDKQSWIHWKASARRNEMMTKDFEERQSQDIVVILDQSPSSLFEDMVSFIATLTNTYLQNRIGIAFTSTAQMHQPIAVGRGEHQRQKVFYALAMIEENETKPLTLNKRSIPANSSYIFVTSQITKELLAFISSTKGYSTSTLLVMKSKQDLNQNEREIQVDAAIRGINCRYIYPTSFERGVGE
ncbi:DUF58 domain-containing protein [Bacillus sp. JJ722]|uniref:DUF58 domain-containing protein n=1 Tax=Bacillus sp. JJ722 TaxID=3122973 RepID=UPI002FFF55E2